MNSIPDKRRMSILPSFVPSRLEHDGLAFHVSKSRSRRNTSKCGRGGLPGAMAPIRADFPRPPGIGGERRAKQRKRERDEEAESENGCKRSPYDHQAAAVCLLDTVASFRQTSIL